MTRRPSAGINRRGALRGIGGGAPASAAPFDPLTDPDLVALFMADDATDDGTTLTIPNRVTANADAVSTGTGRSVIDATALDSLSPGIDMGAATAAITAAISLSGKTQATIIMLAQDETATAGYLWRMATTTAQNFSLATNTIAARRFRYVRTTSGGTVTLDTIGRTLHYPSVVVGRFDMADATEDKALWIDGQEQPVTRAGLTDTTGTIGATGLHIGSNSNAATFFKGKWAGFAVIGRQVTEVKIAQWTTWLRAETGFTSAREVMWCGDSITACSSAAGAMWRERIQTQYDAEGDGVRFYRPVGPLAPADTDFARDYCLAGGGQTSVSMLALLATHSIGTVYVPDVVPICIGTNDFGVLGSTTDELLDDYRALMAEFFVRLPNAKFIIQKLWPRTDSATPEAKVIDWNANYHDAFVAECVGLGMNAESSDTPATLPGVTYLDGLHPDAASGPTIGDAMYANVRTWCGV